MFAFQVVFLSPLQLAMISFRDINVCIFHNRSTSEIADGTVTEEEPVSKRIRMVEVCCGSYLSVDISSCLSDFHTLLTFLRPIYHYP